MSKRNVLIFILVICAFLGFYAVFNERNPQKQVPCAFCSSKVIDAQKFYEDSLVMALYTHKPVLRGHCLIIPKRHVERFEMLTQAEISQMGEAIKKVNRVAIKVFNASAYILIQKNGHEVGQTVPHVHVHYISRKAGDDFENRSLW